MIIQNQTLQLEREYNIERFMRDNIDLLVCLCAVLVLLSAGYDNTIILLPMFLFVVVWAALEQLYKKRLARNLVRCDYMLKQNNFFELVRANAEDYMDLLEMKQRL